MQKINLFNDNERYTELASDLNNEAYAAIKPIFDKYAELGCRIREIAHILHLSVIDEELDHVLAWSDKAEGE